jgi:hypothetical protein
MVAKQLASVAVRYQSRDSHVKYAHAAGGSEKYTRNIDGQILQNNAMKFTFHKGQSVKVVATR